MIGFLMILVTTICMMLSVFYIYKIEKPQIRFKAEPYLIAFSILLEGGYICLAVGANIKGIFYTVLLSMLATVSVIDIKTKTIPRQIIMLLYLSGAIALLTVQHIAVSQAALGALLIGGAMWLLYKISGAAVGLGDVYLCSALGLWLGLHSTFEILVVSVILCGLFALYLLILDKNNKKKEIPLAPFLLLGTMIYFL